MFDMWLRKEENPSWMKIIAALEKMSETNLANRLTQKYQQQSNEENRLAHGRRASGTPPASDDRESAEGRQGRRGC